MNEKRDESVEELAEELESRIVRKVESDELEEIELEDIQKDWFSDDETSEGFWEDDFQEEELYGNRSHKEFAGKQEHESRLEGELSGKRNREDRLKRKASGAESRGSRSGRVMSEKKSQESRFEGVNAGKESRENCYEEENLMEESRESRFEEENAGKRSGRNHSGEKRSPEGFLENRRRKDFSEDEFPEDDWEEDEITPMKPWMMAAAMIGVVALAAIICAVLWHFTHLDRGDGGKEARISASAEDPVRDNDGMGVLSGTVPENASASDPEVTTAPGSEASAASPLPAVPSEASPTPAAPQTTAQPGTQASGAIQEPISGTTSMEFTQSSEEVTPKDVINLRSEPSTLDADNIVAQAKNGEILNRTGLNEATGWTRVEYNGETLYAVTQYLTTDLTYKPPVQAANPNRVNTRDGRVILFTDCSDNITPKEYVNLRTEPSTSEGESTVRCQISNGEVVHRTGYSPDAGWSRVEYNGEVLYVVSSYVYTVE